MGCLKSLLIVFNLLIWIFGVGLVGVGIWIKYDKTFWELQTNLELTQFASASTIIIIAGVVIMVIGFLGCYGGIAEKIWMLMLYAAVVLIIILLEIAAMVIVWRAVSDKKTEEHVKDKIKEAMQKLIQKNSTRGFIDWLQKELQCCGVDGPDDYKGVDIPESCKNSETKVVYKQGCFQPTIDFLKSKANIVGGVALGIFLLELASLVFTLCVTCEIKNGARKFVY